MQMIRIHSNLWDTTTDILKRSDIELASHSIALYRSKEVLRAKVKMGAIAIAYCAVGGGFSYREPKLNKYLQFNKRSAIVVAVAK